MAAKRIRPNRKLKPVTLPAKPRPGFISTLDNRTLLARALRKRYHEVAADLGGDENLSAIKRSLIERFVWLEAILSKIQESFTWAEPIAEPAEWKEGEAPKARPKGTDADAKTLAIWIQANNAYHGLAKTLGIERRMSNDPWAALNGVAQPSRRQPEPDSSQPAEAIT